MKNKAYPVVYANMLTPRPICPTCKTMCVFKRGDRIGTSYVQTRKCKTCDYRVKCFVRMAKNRIFKKK